MPAQLIFHADNFFDGHGRVLDKGQDLAHHS